jgi:hypothetical protein
MSMGEEDGELGIHASVLYCIPNHHLLYLCLLATRMHAETNLLTGKKKRVARGCLDAKRFGILLL